MLFYAGLFGMGSGTLALLIAIARRDNALRRASLWFLAISTAVTAVAFIAALIYISNDPS